MKKIPWKLFVFRAVAISVGIILSLFAIYVFDRVLGLFTSDLWALSRRPITEFRFSLKNPYPSLPNELKHSLSLEPLATQSHANRYERIFVEPYDIKTETLEFDNKIYTKKSYRQKGTVQKELIYDIQITELDGKRISFPLDSPPKRTEHLFVLGCSFAYGDGLNDSETIPWILNKKQTRYSAYNLGKSGWGPNDVLSYALKKQLFPQNVPPKGAAFYLYRDTIDRALNTLQVAGHWAGNNEAVKEVDGKFVSLGKFSEAFPIWHGLYKMIFQMNLTHLIGINWPLYTESNVRYLARMIQAIQMEYKQQTSLDNPFYVVFYPLRVEETTQLRLREALNDLGIPILDYSIVDLQAFMNEPATIPFDGHPNKAANDRFTDLLLRDLPIFHQKVIKP